MRRAIKGRIARIDKTKYEFKFGALSINIPVATKISILTYYIE